LPQARPCEPDMPVEPQSGLVMKDSRSSGSSMPVEGDTPSRYIPAAIPLPPSSLSA